MSRLEDLQPNAALRGILPEMPVTVVRVRWFGSAALERTYKAPDGKVAKSSVRAHRAKAEMVYSHEPRTHL